MSQSILIIKTGNTIGPLLDRGEDFEDWFIGESGCGARRFRVSSLHRGEALPDQDALAGIIITGSAAYVTDEAPWNFTGADYLRAAHGRGIPLLGVCYGHQMLAWAFGGAVEFNAGGRRIGTFAAALTPAAARDPLFGSLPERFPVQVSHQQCVTRLPDDAVRLSAGECDPNQAFRLGDATWGVQFHPEFSAGITRQYILARREAIEQEGQNPGELMAGLEDTPHGAAVLRQFCRLALDA